MAGCGSFPWTVPASGLLRGRIRGLPHPKARLGKAGGEMLAGGGGGPRPDAEESLSRQCRRRVRCSRLPEDDHLPRPVGRQPYPPLRLPSKRSCSAPRVCLPEREESTEGGLAPSRARSCESVLRAPAAVGPPLPASRPAQHRNATGAPGDVGTLAGAGTGRAREGQGGPGRVRESPLEAAVRMQLRRTFWTQARQRSRQAAAPMRPSHPPPRLHASPPVAHGLCRPSQRRTGASAAQRRATAIVSRPPLRVRQASE